MIGRVFTSTHQVFELPALLAWSVVHTGGVPCDSFSVSFLFETGMTATLDSAAGFLALHEGEVVFKGIVDEFSVDLDAGGLTASIHGRGYAARLLDNESQPMTYQDATLSEILRQHVVPYGIPIAETADVRASSVYTVAAGTSQWKALENFCRTYGGFVPRFGRDGTLSAAPEKPGKILALSDSDPVIACSLQEDRYGVLTEALIIDKTRNVSYSVKNQERIDQGGSCRRVLYTPGQSTWAAMRYTGEYQIQQSKEDQRRVTITLPGSFPAFPGDRAAVRLPRLGVSGMFRVCEVENSFSCKDGAVSELILKPVV